MVLVTKHNGEKEQFDPRKLEAGLRRSGASKETIAKILKIVKAQLYSGIKTKKIFGIAFREFRKTQPVTANKYNMKEGLLRLGTSGFPFEMFIERLMQLQGYDTLRNQIAKGKIIPHEIDVDAKMGTNRLMVECKHRSKPWISTHIQTALYVYARFLDVQDRFTQPMLATNTKFTNQVIKYAKGVNMKLLGWHYPKKESLEKMIEKYQAYPVTLLPNMNKEMLDTCLKKGYVLLKDIHPMNDKELARIFGISKKKASGIINACRLCKA